MRYGRHETDNCKIRLNERFAHDLCRPLTDVFLNVDVYNHGKAAIRKTRLRDDSSTPI